MKSINICIFLKELERRGKLFREMFANTICGFVAEYIYEGRTQFSAQHYFFVLAHYLELLQSNHFTVCNKNLK